MKQINCVFLLALFVVGCAGPNPNQGQRTADIFWQSGDYQRAFSIIKPKAELGHPWAQLRLGFFYENGWVVERNTRKAAEWYQKALKQKASGGWAEGLLIGAVGEPGYFNQNLDARIAEFHFAQVYYKGDGIEKDLVKAYVHITNVIDESEGRRIAFCCEFSVGKPRERWFSPKQVDELRNKIKADMNPEQLQEAEELLSQAHKDRIQPR